MDNAHLKKAAALGAVYFLLIAPTLATFRLLGLDESTYAVIIKSAVNEGHWLPLHWDGRPFMDKPPYLLWLQAVNFKFFGGSETIFRLPALLSASTLLAYVFLLGRRLGGSVAAGLFAAVILVTQEHFILYSRLGQLDAPLALCFVVFSYHLAEFRDRGGRHLLVATLFACAAVSIKSWFGFAAPLAALVFMWRDLPVGFSRVRLYSCLWLPPVFAQALWVGMYQAVMPDTLSWMLGFDFLTRMSAGAIVGGDPGKILEAFIFYGQIAWHGSHFALVPGLVGLVLLINFRKKDPAAAWWTAFTALWLLVIFAGMMLSINYYLPLCISLALGCAVLWKRMESYDFSNLQPWLRRLGLFSAYFYALVMILSAGRYMVKAPNPNAGLVEVVQNNPALYPGELLSFDGPWADTEVIRWYSDYKASVFDKMGHYPPGNVLLIPVPGGFSLQRPKPTK